MIASRVGVAALARGAARPSMMLNQNIARALTAGIQTSSSARQVATTKVGQEEGHQILVNQRLNRPVSPHLGIYKLSQSWFSASAWTRITGCFLSGGAYLYFTGYLAAPLLGWHLESASLASAFAAMPWVVNGGVKFLLSFPFVFHFINGIKHLVYDAGIGFKKASIVAGEKLLWASSVLGSLYLAFSL
ncbi:hypothetical protein NLU13_9662 [Sarocladium strictum]|uniref:Succinate dehydrogenase subunit C n=1 Tax=Sarocladium strictum TaxID=5046 RepID=A0AA39GAW2_SARSR|nr:hypothetical protein NLU13_9662 [Sarocladium strictum]